MLNAFKIFKVTFDNVRYFSLPLPNICNALPLPLLLKESNALPLTLLKNSKFFSNALQVTRYCQTLINIIDRLIYHVVLFNKYDE